MAERYLVIPAHVVVACEREYVDAAEAAVAASVQVEKDRVPRVVVRVMSEVRVAPTPKIDIIQIAGCPHA